MTVADNVKKLRVALALEQTELANVLEVSKGTISNWENGLRYPRIPKIRKMLELCKKAKLKFTIEDFLQEGK